MVRRGNSEEGEDEAMIWIVKCKQYCCYPVSRLEKCSLLYCMYSTYLVDSTDELKRISWWRTSWSPLDKLDRRCQCSSCPKTWHTSPGLLDQFPVQHLGRQAGIPVRRLGRLESQVPDLRPGGQSWNRVQSTSLSPHWRVLPAFVNGERIFCVFCGRGKGRKKSERLSSLSFVGCAALQLKERVARWRWLIREI